jgi:hypothetical protein
MIVVTQTHLVHARRDSLKVRVESEHDRMTSAAAT